jgi:hypothetical protein
VTQPIYFISLSQRYPGFAISNICIYYRGALRVRPPRWRHKLTELTTSPFHFAHFLLYVHSFHPELMPSTLLSFHFGRERFVSFFSLKCDRDDSSHLLSAQSSLVKIIHPLAQKSVSEHLCQNIVTQTPSSTIHSAFPVLSILTGECMTSHTHSYSYSLSLSL